MPPDLGLSLAGQALQPPAAPFIYSGPGRCRAFSQAGFYSTIAALHLLIPVRFGPHQAHFAAIVTIFATGINLLSRQAILRDNWQFCVLIGHLGHFGTAARFVCILAFILFRVICRATVYYGIPGRAHVPFAIFIIGAASGGPGIVLAGARPGRAATGMRYCVPGCRLGWQYRIRAFFFIWHFAAAGRPGSRAAGGRFAGPGSSRPGRPFAPPSPAFRAAGQFISIRANRALVGRPLRRRRALAILFCRRAAIRAGLPAGVRQAVLID